MTTQLQTINEAVDTDEVSGFSEAVRAGARFFVIFKQVSDDFHLPLYRDAWSELEYDGSLPFISLGVQSGYKDTEQDIAIPFADYDESLNFLETILDRRIPPVTIQRHIYTVSHDYDPSAGRLLEQDMGGLVKTFLNAAFPKGNPTPEEVAERLIQILANKNPHMTTGTLMDLAEQPNLIK